MHDHRRVHVLQHVQDGFEKPLDDHGLPALALKLRSHCFAIGALSWCDSHRLISLDSSCSSKREPSGFCMNLLLFPTASVCNRTQTPAFAVFLQLADSWYLQNFDTAEVAFTLTVVNRVNPEGSISKGMTPAPQRHVFHVVSWLMETQQPLHLYVDVASRHYADRHHTPDHYLPRSCSFFQIICNIIESWFLQRAIIPSPPAKMTGDLQTS